MIVTFLVAFFPLVISTAAGLLATPPELVELGRALKASWPQELVLRGTLGDIAGKVAAAPIERTALVLVGRALAAKGFRDSALYDADYRRRFRGGDGS